MKEKNSFLEMFRARCEQEERNKAIRMEALKKGGEDERLLALELFGDDGLSDETVIKEIRKVARKDQSEKVRARAIYELSVFGDKPRILAVIIKALFDRSPLVRKEATRALLRAFGFFGETIIHRIYMTIAAIERAREKIDQIVQKLKGCPSLNISTHIWLLSLSPNRAGQTLAKDGKRLHRKEKYIEYKELADFGYKPELLVRTKLEDDRLKATFQVFPDNNPMPINLRFKIGKFQQVEVKTQRVKVVLSEKKLLLNLILNIKKEEDTKYISLQIKRSNE